MGNTGIKRGWSEERWWVGYVLDTLTLKCPRNAAGSAKALERRRKDRAPSMQRQQDLFTVAKTLRVEKTVLEDSVRSKEGGKNSLEVLEVKVEKTQPQGRGTYKNVSQECAECHRKVKKQMDGKLCTGITNGGAEAEADCHR